MSDGLPELALARLVRADEGFLPGDDLTTLVSRFASIESVAIPFEADGITIKPGSLDRPRIVINSRNPPTRRKFTLAHELGHVLIPWHIGTICSHIDDNLNSDDEYHVQEGEANRFASELLVPTAWLADLFQETGDPAAMQKIIIDTVGISPLAATIKLMQCLPPGFVCIETHPGIPTQYHRSPGTVIAAPRDDDPESTARYDRTAHGQFSSRHGQYRYRWWFFRHDHEVPKTKLGRPWREALDDILAQVPAERRGFVRQSLNGVIAAAHPRRGNSVDAYRYIVSRIAGMDYARFVVDHPDFRPFVMARLDELGRGKTRHGA